MSRINYQLLSAALRETGFQWKRAEIESDSRIKFNLQDGKITGEDDRPIADFDFVEILERLHDKDVDVDEHTSGKSDRSTTTSHTKEPDGAGHGAARGRKKEETIFTSRTLNRIRRFGEAGLLRDLTIGQAALTMELALSTLQNYFSTNDDFNLYGLSHVRTRDIPDINRDELKILLGDEIGKGSRSVPAWLNTELSRGLEQAAAADVDSMEPEVLFEGAESAGLSADEFKAYLRALLVESVESIKKRYEETYGKIPEARALSNKRISRIYRKIGGKAFYHQDGDIDCFKIWLRRGANTFTLVDYSNTENKVVKVEKKRDTVFTRLPWAEEVVAAVDRCEGDRTRAAGELGCDLEKLYSNIVTIRKLAKELDDRETLAKIKKRPAREIKHNNANPGGAPERDPPQQNSSTSHASNPKGGTAVKPGHSAVYEISVDGYRRIRETDRREVELGYPEGVITKNHSTILRTKHAGPCVVMSLWNRDKKEAAMLHLTPEVLHEHRFSSILIEFLKMIEEELGLLKELDIRFFGSEGDVYDATPGGTAKLLRKILKDKFNCTVTDKRDYSGLYCSQLKLHVEDGKIEFYSYMGVPRDFNRKEGVSIVDENNMIITLRGNNVTTSHAVMEAERIVSGADMAEPQQLAVEDIAEMTELIYRILKTENQDEDVKWIIEYKEGKNGLSPKQGEVIRKCYSTISGLGDSRLKLRPHARANAPLISVTCERGGERVGKGCIGVDDEITDISHLKVPDALGLAFALAAKPEAIDFIKREYKQLTGESYEEGVIHSKDNNVRIIILKSLYPITPVKLEQYNTTFLAVLTAA
jgi:hypothetical protein